MHPNRVEYTTIQQRCQLPLTATNFWVPSAFCFLTYNTQPSPRLRRQSRNRPGNIPPAAHTNRSTIIPVKTRARYRLESLNISQALRSVGFKYR